MAQGLFDKYKLERDNNPIPLSEMKHYWSSEQSNTKGPQCHCHFNTNGSGTKGNVININPGK